MSLLKEIVRVSSITDYSEPLKERQLRNRAVLFSAVMFLVWGAGIYKAHARHFPGSLQTFAWLLGVVLMLTSIYSGLLQVQTRHRAALRRRLWRAWRLQQGAAGVAFIGLWAIFLGWAIAHW